MCEFKNGYTFWHLTTINVKISLNWLLIPPSRSNNEFLNHLVKKNRKQTQREQFMRNFHGVHSPCRCTSHTNFTFIPSDSGYANSCRDLIIVVSLFILIGSHQRMYSMYIITNYFILNKTYNKLERHKGNSENDRSDEDVAGSSTMPVTY